MTTSPGNLTDQARQAGEQAHHSTWMDRAARIGLVAYAVIYLLVGWLCVQLAFGDHEGRPSSQGAMRELLQQPFGEVLVWVVVVGMVFLVVWKGLEAAVGHRDERDDGKRTRKRVMSAFKAVLYAAVAISGFGIVTHSSGSGGKGGSSTTTWTATVMGWPGGQLLIGAVGLAIIGYGGFQVWTAWTEKFAEKLDAEGRSGRSGRAYLAFGKAGYTAKGIAIGLVGALFVYAAVTHDAKKSGGLDEALLTVLQQPFGPVLLGLIGAGLACYGLFTLARARHLSQ
ncbi:DUF1206 domain-containing protein [Nocardioides sp.]|uniref:DUF1206 domain-containing protein n=1 Tax=Nocardioides sp. TaxID=35761 RepID=UPI003784113A